jgi:hypothetical protein
VLHLQQVILCALLQSQRTLLRPDARVRVAPRCYSCFDKDYFPEDVAGRALASGLEIHEGVLGEVPIGALGVREGEEHVRFAAKRETQKRFVVNITANIRMDATQ